MSYSVLSVVGLTKSDLPNFVHFLSLCLDAVLFCHLAFNGIAVRKQLESEMEEIQQGKADNVF